MRQTEEFRAATPSLESVREVRLMALLHDRVRGLGLGKASDKLGIDRKTLWRSTAKGGLTPRVTGALEKLLLARQISASAEVAEQVGMLEKELRNVRTSVDSGLKSLRDIPSQGMHQLERRGRLMELRQEKQREMEEADMRRREAIRLTTRRLDPVVAL